MIAFLTLLAVLSRAPTPLRLQPAFAARNIVAMFAFLYSAYMGTVAWFSDEHTAIAAGGSAERLFAFTDSGWRLGKFMLGFQACTSSITIRSSLLLSLLPLLDPHLVRYHGVLRATG